MDDEVRDVDAWQGAVTGALLRFDVECSRPERFRFGQLVEQATGRTPVAYRRAILGSGVG